ncbi:cobyrinic acid ac-diamide synthase [Pollutimonas subterranea]|uniref:Cobyrinic acid ac-diamide synthase n=1 Tax=Pollutimonas subterranea TaxID=2045210 RepID=A0A2N4TZ50_9BURK|nr:cobyrinic acid ac-diamide synthase [Pollutimonas subterranea]PLC48046.1 cobyrinic acid ac-diamide synthase [Pollutimonas subterranea]
MNKGIEYWSEHLAAIAAEGIETKAYARRESLSVSALYYWRKRIKAQTHGPVRPAAPVNCISSAFMPVQVKSAMANVVPCSVVLAPGVRLELSQLPTPEWLAALGVALNRQVR